MATCCVSTESASSAASSSSNAFSSFFTARCRSLLKISPSPDAAPTTALDLHHPASRSRGIPPGARGVPALR
eukprot:CAMPEP_0174920226 /NCGR_PEP_ID=MMETSP1355-20121228/4247_1 /TAXON_ID=464990 /ORGANISM="Hemiselmis tepida, Strain CCMP443" /LENGTH=71 /DNA_ID=CAMNT_0016165547 /DNA_START=58 /DNA_END=269 /DNA_ORIENTATION=+